MAIVTQENRKIRDDLVKKYNATSSKTKKKEYMCEIMAHEKYLMEVGQNG